MVDFSFRWKISFKWLNSNMQTHGNSYTFIQISFQFSHLSMWEISKLIWIGAVLLLADLPSVTCSACERNICSIKISWISFLIDSQGATFPLTVCEWNITFRPIVFLYHSASGKLGLWIVIYMNKHTLARTNIGTSPHCSSIRSSKANRNSAKYEIHFWETSMAFGGAMLAFLLKIQITVATNDCQIQLIEIRLQSLQSAKKVIIAIEFIRFLCIFGQFAFHSW